VSDCWPQIVVTAPPGELDALEDALFDAGAASVTAEDAGDAPIFEPAPGETPVWAQTRLRALFPLGTAIAPLVEALRTRWPAFAFHADNSLADRDWQREWLRHFRPMRFGERLWVAPAGMEAEAAASAPAPVIVTLDPGLAFGTGTHPSTASCLRWLDAHPPDGARVMDFGCGSGILGIAAALLGAKQIVCVDIDPQALTATRANAERNGVLARIVTLAPDAPAGDVHDAGYDVVLANILAGPLIALAAELAAFARDGARLKLAGILTEQATAVAEAFAPWFDVRITAIDAEWAAVSGVRRHRS
jgi:ribosomal protein L11 methyltransferase